MGSLYGYELESELPLGRLSAVAGVRGGLSVRRAAGELLDRPGELTAWRDWPGSDAHFALARSHGRILASCTATGDYEIDPGAGTIAVSARAAGEDWEHRLGTTAVPLLLAERGDLVLHASAVMIGGRAALFCGPSGRGKSTLALMASSAGIPVVGEDGAVVALEGERATVWPGARGVRTDAGRGRALRTTSDALAASGPAPVGAVCFLAPRGDELELTALEPARAVSSLVPSLIHTGDDGALRAGFERLVRLLEIVPAFRVSMPDSLAAGPQATRSLVASLSASSAAFAAPSQPSSRAASVALRRR
ncbi:MAG: hypothetical protein QOE06_290 [Thermoleophilaceae bacterium]|jgi:hypothetical protein|nr:hypothetical protein [Thermoleophilaceae bacterium]